MQKSSRSFFTQLLWDICIEVRHFSLFLVPLLLPSCYLLYSCALCLLELNQTGLSPLEGSLREQGSASPAWHAHGPGHVDSLHICWTELVNSSWVIPALGLLPLPPCPSSAWRGLWKEWIGGKVSISGGSAPCATLRPTLLVSLCFDRLQIFSSEVLFNNTIRPFQSRNAKAESSQPRCLPKGHLNHHNLQDR